MNLVEWAHRWRLPPQAIDELRLVLGDAAVVSPPGPLVSEAAAQQRVRAHATARGARLWRNNRGAMTDATGRSVRYGLANESKAQGDTLKSSDLIGVLPGGRFLSVEVKPPAWRYAGTDREQAQLRWLNLIRSFGGAAGFATCEADLDRIIDTLSTSG